MLEGLTSFYTMHVSHPVRGEERGSVRLVFNHVGESPLWNSSFFLHKLAPWVVMLCSGFKLATFRVPVKCLSLWAIILTLPRLEPLSWAATYKGLYLYIYSVILTYLLLLCECSWGLVISCLLSSLFLVYEFRWGIVICCLLSSIFLLFEYWKGIDASGGRCEWYCSPVSSLVYFLSVSVEEE